MAYIYKGTQRDAHLPWPDGRGHKRTMGPAQCGTRSGYLRHMRDGEQVCTECREAKNAYDRDYRERTKYRKSAA